MRIDAGVSFACQMVIHTETPVHNNVENNQSMILANAVKSLLTMVKKSGFQSIAFPAFGPGLTFRFSTPQAVRTTLITICETIKEHSSFRSIRFVIRTDKVAQTAIEALETIRQMG